MARLIAEGLECHDLAGEREGKKIRSPIAAGTVRTDLAGKKERET